MDIIAHSNGVHTVVNVIEKEELSNYRTYIELLLKKKIFNREDQYGSFSRYAEVVGESLLLYVQPYVEEIAQCKLYPTYSFTRRYLKGAIMPKHKDRPSCEISCTITLDYKSDTPWPIWVEIDGREIEVPLNPGEMMWYEGCETPHWRNRFSGDHSTHCFLHFVKADGKYTANKFDKRKYIAANNLFKETLAKRLKSIQEIDTISFESCIYSEYDWMYTDNLKKQFVEYWLENGDKHDLTIPSIFEGLMKLMMLSKNGRFSLEDFKDQPYGSTAVKLTKELVLKGYWDLDH